MDAKFLEDPDMEDIPQTPEAYRDGLYAEIRHMRRTMEAAVWIGAVSAAAVIAVLLLIYYR